MSDKPDPEEFRKILDDELDSSIKQQNQSPGVKDWLLFFVLIVFVALVIFSPAIVMYLVGFETAVIVGMVGILFMVYITA